MIEPHRQKPVGEFDVIHSFPIRTGSVYIYVRGMSKECIGYKYRAVRFVLDLPSYQPKVLVESLEGPDKGNFYVCSLQHFAARYEPENAETVSA